MIISRNPKTFTKSQIKSQYRKALLDKNNYLIYDVNYDKDIVELVELRSTIQSQKY